MSPAICSTPCATERAGALGGTGVISGSLTFLSGASLNAMPTATLIVYGAPVSFQNGSSAVLNGTFLPGASKLVQTDAGQGVSLGQVSLTGSILNFETASLAVTAAPTLDVTLRSNLAALGVTGNQRAVAAGIDAAASAGAPPATFDAIGGAGVAAANAGQGTPAANSAGYGGLAGLDYKILPNAIVGVALGGSSSNFSVNSLSTSGKSSACDAGV